MKLKGLFAALVVGFGIASTAQAVPALYPTPGVTNAATYSFVAATNGNIVAYFAGKTSAYYTSTISLLVNGVDIGVTGLNNQSTAYGTSLNFGTVAAGDVLVFRINVLDTSSQFYSDKTLNFGNFQQIYSYNYAGDLSVPAGTYVGFEDIAGNSAYFDKDYNDNTYVFTNVREKNGGNPLPLPATPLLLGLGLGVMALIAKARKQA